MLQRLLLLSTLHSLHTTLYSPLCTLYSLHSTLYSPLSTLYSLRTLHSLLATLHSLLPTLYHKHPELPESTYRVTQDFVSRRLVVYLSNEILVE
jgi:hypothetical protein